MGYPHVYLLNPNVISELRSEKRCDPRVKDRESRTASRSCFLSVVTILEIRKGIELMRGKDKDFAKVLEVWLEKRVKPVFEKRTMEVSASVAELAGIFSARRTRGLADCLIAATALEYRLQLVTRNVSDFEDIDGLKVVNPWE
ncbi:type II toxin-antitoxin system VapC family toxin (plasmid) [Verrucomicrobiaceae bacterium 227]